ncbi:MAG TPA: hypothetical protein VFX33_07480 [Actinomycetales bacterium]|nr:hypothetical protein [Actinomycetales bacterium]
MPGALSGGADWLSSWWLVTALFCLALAVLGWWVLRFERRERKLRVGVLAVVLLLVAT